DVAHADALPLGADLHHRLAGIVDLPGDFPALGLAAGDRLLELVDNLLEGVAIAVMKNGHPGRRDRALGRVLDAGFWSGLLDRPGLRLYLGHRTPRRAMLVPGRQGP